MEALKQHIIELEQTLLRPEVRACGETLDVMLADEFMEIPSTGSPYLKKHALQRLPDEEPPVFFQQDYQLRKLSEDIVQLVYRAVIQPVNTTTYKYSMRHSLWQHNGKRWQMVFHQGTPCEPFEIISR